MKKLLTTILLTILLPLAAGAYDVEVGGIYYNLDDDAKTAGVTSSPTPYSGSIVIPNSITVNGIVYAVTAIGDWAFGGCLDLTSLTIPSSVTSIGESAFSDCIGLTSLTIPSSVTSIGDRAFVSCSGLTSLTIPSSVKSIGESTFWGCIGLTSLTILEGLTSIGAWAFSGCSGLTSLTIPSSVMLIGECAFFHSGLTSLTILGLTSIGPGAFLGCIGLTSLTIPSSVTSIGDAAFENCSGLTSLTISSSVTSIDREAFYGCSGLTSLTIPEGVTSIGMKAFYGCSGLTSLTIPSSLTSIDEEAFSGCSGLTSLTIPSSLTSIGREAFSGCNGLTSIIVEGGNKVYDSRDNCNAIVETFFNTLIVGCKNTVIPSSVTSIDMNAFSGCSSLTSVTIPSSVWWISGSAFRGCSSLTSIVVEEGNTVYDSRDNCNAIIETSDNTLVVGCKNTVIPSSVTSIGSFAFSGCSSLTSLTIPSSVTSIDAFAFSDCSGLTSLTLPSSLTSIGHYVFSGCSGLTTLTIPSSLTSISENAFYKCSGLTSLTILEGVTSIGNYAFYKCRGLTSLTIPSSVMSIGDYAFEDCSGLTSLTLYEGLTSIGNHAFHDCSGLTSLTIPSSVTSIGNGAFYCCSDLTKVTLHEGLTSIGELAFYGCSGLMSVTVEIKTPLSIDSSTFSNRANATLYVPYGCKAAYEAAPYWKEFKEIVEMPAPATGVTLSQSAVTMTEGEEIVLTTTVTPDDAVTTLTWTSSNEDVVTVSQIGEVYAVAPGSATITVTTDNGLSATCEVTVEPKRVPTIFLSATPEGGAVDKGTAVTLSVKDDLDEVVTDAEVFYTLDGSEPSAKSTRYDQPIVLTEPVTLRAVAMKEGYVRGEISATYTINKVLATGIALSETTVALTEGEEIVLMTTVTPDDAETTLTWTSSNEAVATVSQDGEVRAVAPGSATITVTTDNGLSATCEVTVAPKRVLPTGVTLSTSELTLTEGDDAKLVATVSPADAETVLTWSSDDESVVTVDGEGTVIGVSVGTATITVTTDNGLTAACKVTVTERQQEHGEKQLVVVANLQAGEVAKGTEITLEVQDEDGETVDGADIYYTTDGRTPTQKSTHYEGVVTVNESMTLKAVAYKDGYTHSDVLRLAYIVVDDDSDLQWEDGESGVVYAFNTGDPMAKVQRVRSTAQGHVDIRESITVEGKTYTVTEIPKRAFAGASNVMSVTVPATVTTVGESAFANDGLLALIWQSNIEVPADALPEEGNRSKNFLLYVNRAGQAPYGMGNIVVKTADGYEMPEALMLADGDNFHCPVAFRAANVSYTHSYTMTTGLGSSEGWETLALPFDVQAIRHSDGRTLVPFASWRSDSGNAPFWLYTLSADGFVKAGRIQANTPYILSMPNNEAYLSEYNVGGEVTFAASNATIQPSAALATATTGARTFVPTFRKIRSSSSVATLNSVNRLHSNTGGKAPGSRFISNLRLASPFEAVFEGSADAVRSFGLTFSADGVNAIDEVPAMRHADSPRIYNLQGQRVSTMRKGNLYIVGGKKAMTK